ncbi:MAG: benzoate/H(+) symporter BenE family transporter [Burkholderiaceae bacterium]
MIEPFAQPASSLRRLRDDLNPTAIANGAIGFIFAATGPIAIVLAVGTRGGLDQATLASWVFGSFFVNGLLSILACWLYRMPLAFFWTIPGTVLVGPALTHLDFAEVIGAFHVTGLLMLVLGLSGWVRKAMAAVPMPIVMGMVAGVFLRFGTDWILALGNDWFIAGPMTVAFLLLSAVPAPGRRLPR